MINLYTIYRKNLTYHFPGGGEYGTLQAAYTEATSRS